MPEDDNSIVRTYGLTKVFRDFWLREKVTAVADLDLQVMPKEVLGLLGPNGSGKTTTLKLILGLLFPTRGRITVFGKRPTDVGTKARIGFLPEDTYLYPFLDARETLDYYGRLFHLPRAQRTRRIDMLLEMVGLSSVAYRRVAEYSKGMQRRIGLAQALINDPDLLILDEPTSGMDPIGTRQFKDLIRTLANRGKTVIVSSHLLADVEDVCDRVCFLYGGRQQAVGGVRDMLTKRSHTQIVTDVLDEQTLERICAVLDQAGKEVLEISSPREKLESLFLRVVKEAQERRLDTGGAVATGPVAEFLRGGEEAPEAVIERLVAAGTEEAAPSGDEEPAAARAAGPPDVQEPAEAVIDELVGPSKEPTGEVAAAPEGEPPSAATEPKQETAAAAGSPQADRGVIDDLIGDGGPSEPSDEER